MAVDTNIGKIQNALALAIASSNTLDFGPIVDARVGMTQLHISDDMLSSIVLSYSDFNFTWGSHQWGDSKMTVAE